MVKEEIFNLWFWDNWLSIWRNIKLRFLSHIIKKKTDGLNTRRDISKTGEHKGINIYIYI